MTSLLWHVIPAVALLGAPPADLQQARDHEDRPALERMAADLSAAAQKAPDSAEAQFRAALASAYLSEVAFELHDKPAGERAAKAGIALAERAVALKPDSSDYQRVLGVLCAQMIPANVLLALNYGQRAQDAIDKAVALDPKSPQAYIARGIGNYYRPPMFGGGPELAIRDFQRALDLDKQSAEAYLWLGIALRKMHRNPEARAAFTKSLELNPERVLARQQLEKTPAQ